MHCTVSWTGAALVAAACLWSGAAAAQQVDDPLAAEAVAILKGEVGSWHSRWDDLDENGEVTGSTEGTETFSVFNGERVLLLTTEIPSQDYTGKAFRFYEPESAKLMIVDVLASGRLFILRQDVGGKVIESDPFTGRNGRRLILRFTTIEESAGRKVVNHELSADGGQTWRLVRRQYMEKLPD